MSKYIAGVAFQTLFKLTEKIAVFTTSTIVMMVVVRKLIEWKSEWLSATELGKSIMKK